MSNMLNITISTEVKEALNANKPVVALESTIISHGLPYPEYRDGVISGTCH